MSFYMFNKKNDFEKKCSDKLLKDLRNKIVDIDVYKAFYELIESSNYKLISNLARNIRSDEKPSDFLRRYNLDKAVPVFIKSKENQKAYLNFIDKLNQFQCTKGFERRSCRINSYEPFMYDALVLMYRFFLFSCNEVSMGDFLKDNMSPEKIENKKKNYYSIAEVIAAILDYEESVGKKNLKSAIEEIILSESNTYIVTNDIIEGICKSSVKSLHELLGKFLLAAKLQEGIRQSICEKMDCGTVEAFFTIFNVIYENNLIRYSSVKRAVATWIGMINLDSLDRVSNKSVELIHDALFQKGKVDEMLDSDDAMQILTGLWTKGFYNVLDSIGEIKKLIESESRVKNLVAAYYCSFLRNIPFMSKILNGILNYAIDKKFNDRIILSYFLESYMPNFQMEIYNLRERVYKVLNGIEENKFREVACYTDSINQYAEKGLCKPFDYYRPTLQNYFESSETVKKHFDFLYDFFKQLKKKNEIVKSIVFPWDEINISKTDLAAKLCFMGILVPEIFENNKSKILELTAYSDSGLGKFFLNPDDLIVREFVFKNVRALRKSAIDVIKTYDVSKLSDEEIKLLIGALKYKDYETRKGIILILKSLNGEKLNSTINLLLSSKESETRFCGLDIISSLINEKKSKINLSDFISKIEEIKNPEEKERILINQIFEKEKSVYENKISFYDVGKITNETIPDYNTDFFDKEICNPDCEKKLKNILIEFDKLIKENQNSEYISASGDEHTLGEKTQWRSNGTLALVSENGKFTLPFMDLWSKFYDDYIKEYKIIFQLWLLNGMHKTKFNEEEKDTKELFKNLKIEYFGKAFSKIMLKDFEYYSIDGSSLFADVYFNEFFYSEKFKDDIKFHSQKNRYFKESFFSICHKAACDTNVEKYFYNIKEMPWMENSPMKRVSVFNAYSLFFGNFSNVIEKSEINLSDEDFKFYFNTVYAIHRNKKFDENNTVLIFNSSWAPYIKILDYIRACVMGLISKDTVYYAIFKLLNFIDTNRELKLFEKTVWDSTKKYSISKEVFEQMKNLQREIVINISNKFIQSELLRGEQAADYSEYVVYFENYFGVENALKLLNAFGKEKFLRSGFWNKSKTERAVTYSHILRNIKPFEEDTPEKISEIIKTLKISETRLFEFAMYNAKMIPFVNGILKIPLFESGCYYFIAHMNETLSDEQYSIVAKYTSLSKEDLQKGAFALDWFRKVYNDLGEKTFGKMYESAKYISDGAKHSRARKYVDAANGLVTQEDLEIEIEKNRNKDLLMSYSLIPIPKENFTQTLLHRYEFLQRFSKQSKQYGSQRQQSEKICLEVAYENLSQAAGYSDVNRLFLNMESVLIDELKNSFEWNCVQDKSGNDYWIRIGFDSNEKLQLECTKDKVNEKIQKSIPASLKKNELVEDFQDKIKHLKTQYSRTKQMLEDFMCSSVEIKMDEIEALRQNPVIGKLISNLVFCADNFIGMLSEDFTLTDFNGKKIKCKSETNVRIVHCFELYQNNIWHEWQKFIFDKKIVQPFKQVFRELYLKLDEEKLKCKSMMFAGHQIQPKKTIATLKSRRWIASYEQGLFKIFHKENLIATIYAVCDWFSPSEIEAPTLEYVEFSRRIISQEDFKNKKIFSINDIPDVLYSEIMRDVDLAVSVAHVGAVDPETSHSTIEMRKAILDYTLPLFKIGNVKIEKTFAFIKGERGEYKIHLGTGLIHKISGGQINVLAVQSQQRGKIFLPFMDEDPKTAEIISKIILFARDKEIKDPTILEQL